MRKMLAIALFLGTISFAAFGQENEAAPRAEFFGGYQYTRFDGGVNANGWDTTVAGNLNRWFGVAADFSGAYNSTNDVSVNDYTYTFGPVVSYRHNAIFTPFAHVLAGGSHSSASFSGVTASANGFTMMAGGGVDLRATKSLALRAIQFDWISLHSNGVTDNNNMRVSTGIVFRY